MCRVCKQFLSDFLETGIHKELDLSNYIRISSLRSILPELTEWIYRFYQKVSPEEFSMALITSARIARRERNALDYEYLIHTATFNFLKFQLKWIDSEVDYIKSLLIESGFIRTRHKQGNTNKAYDYISYTVPRSILMIQDIHKNHVESQGLMTDLSNLYAPRQDIIEDELYG